MIYSKSCQVPFSYAKRERKTNMASQKRRDSKNRVLRNGESQRDDGQYMFRYTDQEGKRRAVYSWRLVETDKLPDGKRNGEALRTMEQRIRRDLEDGICSGAAQTITLNQEFEAYMAAKSSLAESTRYNYRLLYDTHIRNDIGMHTLGSIKYSRLFTLYAKLFEKKGLSTSTVRAIHIIVWSVFELAVRDDIIRRNPADDVLKNAISAYGKREKKRAALTVEQQTAFINYVYGNEKYKKYGPLFTVLLGTGMRIGEALGLTWNDIDFSKGFVSVNHAIIYKPVGNRKYIYKITSPKTLAGIRDIPMFEDVRNAFKKVKRAQKEMWCKSMEVDGYGEFAFINPKGNVYEPSFIYGVIQNIVFDYNREEQLRARKNKTQPELLPKLSAHLFRHTFCTRLCENESNLKVIQEVMGHKNIKTTMNIYNEATKETLSKSFKGIEGKFKLA